MIVIVDQDDGILDLNSTAATVLGENRKTLAGSKIGQFLGPVYQELKNSGKKILRIDGEAEDAVTRELEVRPVLVAGRSLWVLIGRDVSHRVEVETSLKELNQNLEEKVRERTMEITTKMRLLKETRDQLIDKEKMAALGNLVAGIAHEINTPLGVGVTAGSKLNEDVQKIRERYRSGDLTEEEFIGILETLEESSRLVLSNIKRAAGLVNSFKQVAVDRSYDHIRRIDFRGYIEEIVQSLYPQWKKHTVEIEGRLNEDFSTVPGDWSQILTNLIVNSVNHGFRHRLSGGRIQIRIDSREDRIILDYSDNGIGMNDEQRTKVFDRFFTTARDRGGSGVGMNIVHNLITLKMRGTIECPKQDSGARFVISVPVH